MLRLWPVCGRSGLGGRPSAGVGWVAGTYLHGVFESGPMASAAG